MPLQTIASEFRQSADQLPPEPVIFGRSEHMQALRNRFERVAALNVPVLIEGESGTGKEIFARMLHQRSPWRSGIFVKVRCSCIPDSFDDLLDSSNGILASYTDTAPAQAQTFCFGTLFVDEVSETSPTLQAKMLRLLQDGQFCRITVKRCKLNLRVVCATNGGLEDAAERGIFRRDLLYRINVLTMRVPPLRERMVDIPELVDYFLELFSKVYNCNAKRPSRRMLQSLVSYSWPGNIRELENLMKRYVLFGCEESVCQELIDRVHQNATQELSEPGGVSLKEITRKAVRELERDAILKVLEANHWNRKRAACVLNISYRALLYKLKDAGMAAAAPAESRLAARRVQNTVPV